MKYYVILLALGLVHLSPSDASETGMARRSSDNTKCAAALAYINAVISDKSGKQFVFSDDWESVSYPLTAGGWFLPGRGTRGPAPPRSMLIAAKRQGGRSAIKYCPSIQVRLKEGKIPFGVEAVSAAVKTARGRDFRYNVEIVGVSIPTLSKNGTEAVLYSSQVSGPLAGGAYIYYMKCSSLGKWSIISYNVLTTA